MSNIAVIKLAGAQHIVRPGDRFEVNRLDYEVEKDMSADVLLSTKGDNLLMKEGDVQIKVTENKLGEKLRIVKFRAKSRYRRAQGHRQHLSVVEVLSVNGETKSAKAKESTVKDSVKSEAKVAKTSVKKEAAPKATKTVAKKAATTKISKSIKKGTK
jgi:large subunit ribosomal protein L21